MKNVKKFMSTLMALAVFALFAVSCGGSASVEEVVNATAKTLPADAGNGMMITQLEYEDGQAWYVYETAPGVLANAVSQGEENMAKIFANAMTADDPLVIAVLNENSAINYCFVDAETQEEFEFTVTADDLQHLKK